MNFIKDFWDIIWEVLGWFQICTFIDPWEEGILTRRGRYKRNVGGPVKHFLGVAWHFPFEFDEITCMNVKPTAMELEEQSVTTADNKKIVCKGVMMWGVFDVKKAFIDVEDADQSLGDLAVGIIQEQVETQDWEYIRTPEFRDDCKKAIQRQARKFGVSVSKFKFQDLVLADAHRIFGGLSS